MAISDKNKKAVELRANGLCEYCKSSVKYSIQPFSIEHIIPKSKGGGDTIKNLAFACQGCNGHKYNKTEIFDEITKVWVPLFHPRLQTWEEHFKWDISQTIIEDLTDIGRVTIKTLKLNREGCINIRKLLK